MNRPRVFLDTCILIEGLVSPWSASRGVLILGRASLLQFVLAEIVIEEAECALCRRAGKGYGGAKRLAEDFRLLIKRIKVEHIPYVSAIEFEHARHLIRHINDVPVLAAAIKAKPDWLLTSNTSHFDSAVAKKTGLRIVNPAQFLHLAGRIFPL